MTIYGGSRKDRPLLGFEVPRTVPPLPTPTPRPLPDDDADEDEDEEDT